MRHQIEVNQEQMAELLGATRETISRWETGAQRIPPPVGSLFAVLEAHPRAVLRILRRRARSRAEGLA